jgi:hypothetical protein
LSRITKTKTEYETIFVFCGLGLFGHGVCEKEADGGDTEAEEHCHPI